MLKLNVTAKGVISIALVVVLACSQSASAQDCIDTVERTMRRFQTRYHAKNGEHLPPWPECSEGSYTPPYPKDDFYDNALAGNPDLAVRLVKHLRDEFESRKVGMCLRWSDIPGASPRPWYTTSGVGGLSGATDPSQLSVIDPVTAFDALPQVTRENYCEVLADVDSYLSLFDTLIVPVTGTGTVNGTRRGMATTDACHEPLCAAARDCILSVAQSGWYGQDPWGAEPTDSRAGVIEEHKGSNNERASPAQDSDYTLMRLETTRANYFYDMTELPATSSLFALYNVCGDLENPRSAQGDPFSGGANNRYYALVNSVRGGDEYLSPTYGDLGAGNFASLLTYGCGNLINASSVTGCWHISEPTLASDLDPDSPEDDIDCCN